jgi:hypothetical protein
MSFPIIQKSLKDKEQKEKIALYTQITEEIQEIFKNREVNAEEAELILATLASQISKKAKQSYKL